MKGTSKFVVQDDMASVAAQMSEDKPIIECKTVDGDDISIAASAVAYVLP